MAATLEFEPDDICVLRVSGIWKRSESDAGQAELAENIVAGGRPRILAILENFEGWERGVDWNEFEFLFAHSHNIERIAIVSDARWQVQALAFAGAGVRRAPVQFFPPHELAKARAWLASKT